MSAHPFDLKTVVLAKHAQHVVVIHFPMALFLTGVALDFAAQWTKKSALGVAAYINLVLAAIATVPAVATGLIAWQWALEGQRLKGVLLMHLASGLVSTVLIWVVWTIHWRGQRRTAGGLSGYRLVIETIAVLLVGLTGHLGGFLSGVNGGQ